MVPGHTKFWPDVVFSTIARRYYRSDVFSFDDMIKLISDCDINTLAFNASQIYGWSEYLKNYFNVVPRITSYRFFETLSQNEYVSCSEKCFYPEFGTNVITKISEVPVIDASYSYVSLKKMKKLSNEKILDLKKCYRHLQFSKDAIRYLELLLNSNEQINEEKLQQSENETFFLKRRKIDDNIYVINEGCLSAMGRVVYKEGSQFNNSLLSLKIVQSYAEQILSQEKCCSSVFGL